MMKVIKGKKRVEDFMEWWFPETTNNNKSKGAVIITGGDGQLAQSMKFILNLRHMDFLFDYTYIFATREDLDITCKSSIKNYLSLFNDVKYVVNCAAYTNVNLCEKQAQYRKEAERVNAEGVKNLAEICKERDIFLITIGTDYLYDGTNIPIKETDDFCPKTVYGKTKAVGIHSLENLWCDESYENQKYLIINTSWLYSEYGNNFVKTIYNKLKDGQTPLVVINQIGCPTYAPNLAHFIIDFIENNYNERLNYSLIKEGNSRRINFSGMGTATWYDIAIEIGESMGLSDKISPDYRAHNDVIRPNYSIFDLTKATRLAGDFYFPHWRKDLKKCVKNLK